MRKLFKMMTKLSVEQQIEATLSTSFAVVILLVLGNDKKENVINVFNAVVFASSSSVFDFLIHRELTTTTRTLVQSSRENLKKTKKVERPKS